MSSPPTGINRGESIAAQDWEWVEFPCGHRWQGVFRDPPTSCPICEQPAASTTGNPPKAGTCPRCGGQLYAGLTHGCTTVPQFGAGGGPGVTAATAPLPPWIALYMRLQAELNMLSSVSIEVPALRPAAKALREALGD